MAKINSKNKGAGFEREIVKKLIQWTGKDFQRSPSSGAWGTTSNRDDFRGDIVCSDPNFRYSIECKKVESVWIEHLLCNKKCLLYKYWNQCVSQCSAEKEPLLIFSKNRSPIYCMSITPPPLNSDSFKYNGVDPSCASKILSLFIYKFEDLLNSDPNMCFLT